MIGPASIRVEVTTEKMEFEIDFDTIFHHGTSFQAFPSSRGNPPILFIYFLNSTFQSCVLTVIQLFIKDLQNNKQERRNISRGKISFRVNVIVSILILRHT